MRKDIGRLNHLQWAIVIKSLNRFAGKLFTRLPAVEQSLAYFVPS